MTAKEQPNRDPRYLTQELGLKEYSSEVDLNYFLDYIKRAGEALDGDLAGASGQSAVQRIREADWQRDEGADYLFHVDVGQGPQPLYFSYAWDDQNTIRMVFFSPPDINAVMRRLGEEKRPWDMVAPDKKEQWRKLLDEAAKKRQGR